MIIEYTEGTVIFWVGMILLIISVLVTISCYRICYRWDLETFAFFIAFGSMGIICIILGFNMDYGFLVFKMIEP
jgi:hypothetical protein